MARHPDNDRVTVVTDDGALVGWVEGDGPPVLLLHGGPGLSYGYLDELATVLGPGYRTAAFQQRGLAPSSLDGPFTVARAMVDVEAFLDALGWERAFVVGHSWGGHLLLHLAVSMPQRLLGALAVDPLGAAGDGGLAPMQAEMGARTPPAARQRLTELAQAAAEGSWTDDNFLENLRLVWPAYFASADDVPAMPSDQRASYAAYTGLFESLMAEMATLADRLPDVAVPFGFVAGAESPLSAEAASTATAALIPGAWVAVVSGAGHFPWYERPDQVRAALARLVAEAAASGEDTGDR